MPVKIHFDQHKPVLVGRKISAAKIEDLPNEILLMIFSYLNLRTLGKCAQLSYRFKSIAYYPTFWETVVVRNREIPAGFVKLAITLGCKHLHLEGCTIAVIKDSDYVIHKLPKDNQVKTLNLREYEASCDGLMIACRNLEKVSLSSLDFSKGWHIPSIVRNAATLKTLDLSNSYDITFKQVKRIFSACGELRELDLSCCCVGPKHKKLSAQSIEFIFKNVPSFIEKLNLSGQAVTDDHFEMLLERCKNITELCLCNTHITRGFWTTLPEEITKVVKCEVQRYVY